MSGVAMSGDAARKVRAPRENIANYWRDFRFGFRLLGKNKGFALAAVLMVWSKIQGFRNSVDPMAALREE